MGTAPFACMLSEHHHLQHDVLEFQYLTFRQQKHLEDVTVPAFSTFNDPLGYAGFTPSAKYLTKVYNDFVEEKVIHHFQHISSLPANIVHVNHSHKVTKHLCKLDGVKIFEGLFTMTNEIEEIHIQHFVPSTSMDYVKKSLDDMKLSLISFGHSMPKVLFTDKVDYDKKFFEMQFESLKEDIQAVRSTDPHKNLPVLTLPESVTYTVHSTETQINDALTPLLEQLDDLAYNTTVRFNAEWTFSANTYSMWKLVAVVQELASLAKERGFTPTATASLANICAIVLRKRPLKEKSVRESNWEGNLSSEQLNYAALDAWVSLELFSRMSTVLAAAQILDYDYGLQPGLPVTLLSNDCIRPVAYSKIIQEAQPRQASINTTMASSVVASYEDDITTELDTNLSYALDYDIDNTPSEEAEEDESESELEEITDQELDTSIIDIDSQRLGCSLLDPIYNKA
ncbi:hypothetical protein EC973_006061 [Apophysomyces ossiformis]|uniref:3'-5' exonuclease domain-containing protein n=1 Tax=Apophysomyces ossiformis TaxID=679940 RepID=A0A8H7BJV9_9FUNG|nr:hypothetical protein EC973_006061 [Apophysomyces ossiformis]